VIAIVAALASALCYGLASVLQHRGAQQAETHAPLRLGLLVDLVRQPAWLVGTGADVGGLGFQAFALASGAVALVQPLLVTGLLFAVIMTALFRRRWPGRAQLLGAGLCVLGLAVFLEVAQPAEGTDRMAIGPALAWIIGVGAGSAACIVVSRRKGSARSALLLGIATGLLYGLSAAMAKVTLGAVQRDPVEMFTTWPFYVLLVVGGAGYLLNQNAFQAGELAAPLAALTVLDPVVSIAIGATALSESLNIDGFAPLWEVVALGAMTAGVVVLARHAARHQPPVTAGKGTGSAAARRSPGPAAPGAG
jgi:drug/metabolite transporter (DMT)-like permease